MAVSIKHRFRNHVAHFKDEHIVTGVVTSVNSIAPDSSGNVSVTVGGASPSGAILSINGESPDVNGNIVITHEHISKTVFTITSDTDVYPITSPYVVGTNDEGKIDVYCTNYPVYISFPKDGYAKDVRITICNDNCPVKMACASDGVIASRFSGIYTKSESGWDTTTPTGNADVIILYNYDQYVEFQKASTPINGMSQHYVLYTNVLCYLSSYTAGWGNSADITSGLPKRYTLNSTEYAMVADGTIIAGQWFNGSDIPDNAIGVSGQFYLQSNGDVYIKDSTTWSLITNIANITNSNLYHGIESCGTPTYSGTSVTIPLQNGAISYWYNGVRFTSNTQIVQDMGAISSNTLYFIYFSDASGVLSIGTSFDIKTNVPVCMIWKNASGAVAVGKETHNHTRNIDWHINTHKTIGARYQSGLALSNVGGAGASFTWTVSSGTIFDEDIEHTINTATQITGARVWYPTGSSTLNFVDQSYPFLWNGTRVKYINSAGYIETALSATEYIPVWCYASNDTIKQIYFIIQATASPYQNVTSARAELPPNLSGFGISSELKLLHRLIIKGDGTYIAATTADDFRTSSSLPSGGVSAPSAATVTFAPATGGNLSSTNVQGAIDELEAEKVQIGLATASGLTMSTNRLLGRTTASSGAIEEISIGTNLTLSGGTLNATGGSSGGVSEQMAWFIS